MNLKCLAVAALGLLVAASSRCEPSSAWYLDVNMLSLGPANKYVGRVVARNASDAPVHIQASVRRIELLDGKRKLIDDTSGVIGVFPQEFVLRPGEAFPVRLIANPAGVPGSAQSYYVRLQDVSKLQALKNGNSAAAAGFLLAFDTLVAINKDKVLAPEPDQFAVRKRAAGGLEIVNNSGRHVYMNGGAACPGAATVYNDCESLVPFPRQSLLPGEALAVPDADAPFVALLVYPDLDVRRPPAVVHVKVSR
jgi:hypothetical protein